MLKKLFATLTCLLVVSCSGESGAVKHGKVADAPVIGSMTAAGTGTSTASVSVTVTNVGNGALYEVITTNGSTPSAAQIKAGNDASNNPGAATFSTVVSTLAAVPWSATGLNASTSYFAYAVQQTAAGVFSNITSASFSTSAGAVATLSAPTAQAVGWSDVRGGVTTDTGSGTLYYIASTNTSTPTATQVKTCKDAGGATVSQCSNVAVSSSGAKTPLKLGAFANSAAFNSVTAYKMFFVQNTSGGDSNVVGATFTTSGKLTITAADDLGGGSCPAGQAWTDNPQLTQYNAVRANVLSFFQRTYSSVTDASFKITFGWQCINGGGPQNPPPGGASSQYFVNVQSYSTSIRPKLLAVPNQNQYQTSAYSHLPASDPTGIGDVYEPTDGASCMNGTFVCTNSGANEGWVGIGSGTYNLVADGTTNTGQVQLWELMHHEISEVIGRNSGVHLGNARIQDAISFSSTGVVNATSTGNRYPSADNGATSVYGGTSGFFQNAGCNSGAGDCGDLDGSVGSAFNAFVSAIIANPPLPGDMRYMTIGIGLTLTEIGLNCAEQTTSCTAF